jgi:hypothetical protein
MQWNGNGWGGGTKVMRVSKKPSPEQTIINQKQLKNVKYFSYLCSVMVNVLQHVHVKLKPGLSMTKASLQHEKALFHQQLGLKFM